ncbi:RNA methyltransferase [Myxococcota bacterium]|nr:RNA methyltransferase [Myxococcota bacterium]MBU1430787.1 RNA methyltransferase [Myxococcota bacterium]MBU1897341.1 RNA methyltransferase [Myxococcota bacterium]
MKPREALVYGLNAALAVGAHRPQAIRRVLYTREAREAIGALLSATAKARRPYREVVEDELRRVCGTPHHGGVVVITDPLPIHPPDALDHPHADALFIALDGVGNPHNLGAILRSAAWFGVDAVIIPDDLQLSGAVTRVALGGAEVVPCVATARLSETLRYLREDGVTVLAADQGAPPLDLSAPLPRPLCLVLGHESEGLSAPVRQAASLVRAIPGTHAVESLNVSVSAGILLAAASLGHAMSPALKNP